MAHHLTIAYHFTTSKALVPILFVSKFSVTSSHAPKYAIDDMVISGRSASDGCYNGECWQPSNNSAGQWLQIDTLARHLVGNVELEYRYDVTEDQLKERFKNIEVKSKIALSFFLLGCLPDCMPTKLGKSWNIQTSTSK